MGLLDVAIHISATNGVSSVLAAISKEAFALEGSIGKIEKAFQNLKPVIAGVAIAFAGIEMFKGLEYLEKAGEDLVHTKVMLEAALPAQNRLTDAALAYGAANKEAGDNMRTSIEGNIDAMHDLYTVTQNMQHSADLLPSFNLLKNSYDSVNGGEGATKNVDVINMLKGFEIAGRNTTEALKKIVPLADQMVIGLKGRVTGSDVRQQIQATGIARYGYDDEFLSQRLPIMVATGLKNAGVALYQFRRMMVNGVVSDSKIMPAAEIKYGLHTAADEAKDDKGKVLGFKPGTLWENDLAKANPTRWGVDYRAHLKGMGYDVDDPKKMDSIISEIAARNKNLAAALAEVLMPQAALQQAKEFANINNVAKDAQQGIDANDPKAWRQALDMKMKDVEDILGEGLVKPFIDNILKPITVALKDISQLAAAHPLAVANIMKGLLAVSAAMIVFGGALAVAGVVAAIGLMGTAAVGIAAVCAAIAAGAAAIALISPGTLTSLFKGLVDGIKTAFDGFKTFDAVKVIRGIAAIFNAQMMGLPALVAGAIGSAIAGIGSAISSAISGLAHSTPTPGEGAHGRGGSGAPVPRLKTGSYAPPGAARAQVAANVYLDRDKVGKVMGDHFAMNNRAVNSAADHDGRSDWTHPEYANG